MRTCGSPLRTRRNGAKDREVELRAVGRVGKVGAEVVRNSRETYLEGQGRASPRS